MNCPSTRGQSEKQDPPTTLKRSGLCPSETRKRRRSWWISILWLKHWIRSTGQDDILAEDLKWINKVLGRQDWLGARHWLCTWHQLSHSFFPASLWDRYCCLALRCGNWGPEMLLKSPRSLVSWSVTGDMVTWSMTDLRLERRPVRFPICHYSPSALQGLEEASEEIWTFFFGSEVSKKAQIFSGNISSFHEV